MKTLQEIETKVIEKQAKCIDCGTTFQIGDIRNYNHTEGVDVSGFDKKQWVFFSCQNQKCQSDIALWKIVRDFMQVA